MGQGMLTDLFAEVSCQDSGDIRVGYESSVSLELMLLHIDAKAHTHMILHLILLRVIFKLCHVHCTDIPRHGDNIHLGPQHDCEFA